MKYIKLKDGRIIDLSINHTEKEYEYYDNKYGVVKQADNIEELYDNNSKSLKALIRLEEKMAVTFKHYKQDVSYIRDDLIRLKLVKKKLSSLYLEKSDDKCYLITKSKERYLSHSYKIEIPEELYLFFVYIKEVLENDK